MAYGRMWPNWSLFGKSQVWNGTAAHGAWARGVSTLRSTNPFNAGHMCSMRLDCMKVLRIAYHSGITSCICANG